METEIYESEPFSERKQDLMAKFTSDYRFEKGDELYLHQGEGLPVKIRIIHVRVQLQPDGHLTREILVLKA